MRIAILSDFHFGFGAGSERAEDCYDAFREAVEKALGCDLMIFAGDMFDTRNPDAETLARAMELMVPALLRQNDIRLLQGIGKDASKVSEIAVMGIPIVAIHGTHERRTKGFLNPVEALEKAGFLVYLHCNGVIFEKEGERVAIQGMSGVPDQYADGVLSNWNPAPEHGCFNIFVLHQSITEFLYAEHTLDLNKLPKGFDLYVNGHIHEAKESEYDGKPFILTGSLIPTQIKEGSEAPKGFYIAETSVRDLAGETPDAKKVFDKKGVRIYWLPLERQRKVYARTFENPTMEGIEKEIDAVLAKEHEKNPIVRIDLKGKFSETLAKEIEVKFGSRAILSLKKAAEKGELPRRTLEEHKLSVEETGRKIMLENLKKAGLNQKLFENLFELLVEGKTDETIDLLTKAPEREGKAKNPRQTMLFRHGSEAAEKGTN
jgi:DNA repair exonuclease SbcCD nuclease subunit